MADLSGSELVTRLQSIAESEGLRIAKRQADRFTADREIPLSKWILGARKAVYRLSCEIDEPAREVRFRESTTESSWGIQPPTFRAEVTSQSGTRVHDTTTIKSTAGGGQFGIGPVRDAIEAAVNAAGWQFRLEAGRRP